MLYSKKKHQSDSSDDDSESDDDEEEYRPRSAQQVVTNAPSQIQSYAAPQAKPVVMTGSKPSFDNLISLQLSDGNWSEGAQSTIVNFFSDGNIRDATIDSLL